MSLFLNVSEFWIYQGPEYTSGFEYARILDISEFWICQGYTGFRVCLSNSWICLYMLGYGWVCVNIPEYAVIYLNLPEWLLLCITPFPQLFYNSFSTWTRGYLFECNKCQEVINDRRLWSEGTWGCFLEEIIFGFFIATGSTSFAFCFRRNIFTSKI